MRIAQYFEGAKCCLPLFEWFWLMYIETLDNTSELEVYCTFAFLKFLVYHFFPHKIEGLIYPVEHSSWSKIWGSEEPLFCGFQYLNYLDTWVSNQKNYVQFNKNKRGAAAWLQLHCETMVEGEIIDKRERDFV